MKSNSQLEMEINELRAMLRQLADSMDDGNNLVNVPAAGHNDDPPPFPFQIYVKPGATNLVCVRTGRHYWYRQTTGKIHKYGTSADTLPTVLSTLDPTNGGTGVAQADLTVYVKRIYYPATDTASVSIHADAADVESVLAGVTDTEARWIIGTVKAAGGIEQYRTGGDIYELRVA